MRNASSGDKATKLRDASSGDKATKCSNHSTISLIAYTPKIVAKILRRRTEKKIEDVLGELENISLVLEEEKELGMQLGCSE